ncbi:hypothetical protein Y032_0508g2701 [Ancylostoma ceylanicum]|uniref:Uncharacterized protein n=1 Tax=Ancylostoma ceylanicum TaxID=53326 RepID=A0A016WVC2_9BILA|nr:hypothetical protein Y032_0508g2701 [Ancylostoma ceylanicum]
MSLRNSAFLCDTCPSTTARVVLGISKEVVAALGISLHCGQREMSPFRGQRGVSVPVRVQFLVGASVEGVDTTELAQTN